MLFAQISKPLILDGATGTEIDRRGIPTTLPLWSAGALETHPDVVRQIHVDYINAGADIITTNTFRTHTRNVGDAAQAATLTHTAVELARQAANTSKRKVYVAGSIAPLEDCYSPHLTPSVTICRREHTEMVENMLSIPNGVDFLLLETMNTIHEVVAAAEAAHARDVPFAASFVLDEHANLLSGESLAATVEALTPYQPSALLINCIPTRHINEALTELAKHAGEIPIGAYGNMGTPDDVVGWAAAHDMSPEHYCEHAAIWVKQGAMIIGSCCGSNPKHTVALRQMLAR